MDVYFSPLQGFTEAEFRNLHSEVYGGVDAYYTPFIRLEKGMMRSKDKRDIAADNNRVGSLVPQIMASEKDEFCMLVELVSSLGYKHIDLNMGCPFPLLVKKCKGSGILPYPEKVEAVLSMIEQYPDIEFSLKTRFGQNSKDEIFELLPFFNSLRLKHITLHPRIGSQKYDGEVDFDTFARFYSECKIPVVYNGDVNTVEQASEIARKFPLLKGIMIGRGMLRDPSLASRIKNGKEYNEQENVQKLRKLHDSLLDYFEEHLCGETQILQKIKPYWEYFMPSLEKKERKQILKASSVMKYKLSCKSVWK